MNFYDRFRVKPGAKVDLARFDPDSSAGANKASALKRAETSRRRLAELQEMLYAEGRRSVLIVLQAMDAGGKDGTIRHVMSGVNPQGCRVTTFKAPTAEELAHDFLWRIHKAVPRRGEIGIFNRSHYEDVLIVRVHELVSKEVWSRRYEEINNFEAALAAAGTHILKFFLHISPDEQARRITKRLHDPHKQWKFNPEDIKERAHWKEYMKAYGDALGRCSTAAAPWFIIPANKKWYRNLVISSIVAQSLEGLKMKYPQPTFDPSNIVVK
ncbi:MAG: polyphosphate kinase 2 family protein [Phycisphaerae bacterium]|jgi:PPK2 family polyphosphate:nucleotide phosphotransferase